MKRILFLTMVLWIAASGCTTHYYKARADGVELILKDQRAGQVGFACSLDQFAVRETRNLGRGKWAVTVTGGDEFRYFYLVDDKVFIPDCPLKETDDFGSENCIYRR
jgi:hypothetical protein